VVYLWVELEVVVTLMVVLGAIGFVVRRLIRQQLAPMLRMLKPQPKSMKVPDARL
jgi:hypothetical protein